MVADYFLNLFSVTLQLGSITQTDIVGIKLVYQCWALCLAEDLSTSQGCEVLVNVGVIVVCDSAQQPGVVAHWERLVC